MDRKAWVMRALEALRFATFQEIQRYLDEEGEPFSRKELQDTLKALVQEGRVEEKEGTYRLAPKKGDKAAFEKLFGGEP
jgi:DNA-binding HxlR family transcriptional regulator